MADDKRDSPRPFDVRTVEYLLRLMSEHDLSEIALREGDQSIRLRKGTTIPAAYLAAHAPGPVMHPGLVNPGHAAAPVGPGANSSPAAQPQATATPARNLLEIKSPMVGTFYSKPKPDKPDFVSVGSVVKPDTVVCLIEAIKLYNDINAEV